MRLLFLLSLAAALPAQTFSPLNCIATSVPTLVRLEGVAERIGDIVLNCTGGTPNGLVRGDLRVISYSGNITNKLNATTGTLDSVLTVNTGAGEISTGATAQVRANNQFDFAGMNFNLGPAGTATFRMTNIRVTPPQGNETPFVLAFATNGPSAIRIDNSPLSVGIATRGLLAAYSPSFICTVSGLPNVLTFNNLLTNATRFSSMRFTEGYPEAFLKLSNPADNGTRIVVRFTGLPAAAHLIVPDALAGSSATVPTAAGDLGLSPSGGRYTSGNGQLLLSRVLNTDANGAGGVLAFTPPAGVSELNGVTEVPIVNGAAIVVFEVLDSNPVARESVQLPVFVGLEQRPAGGSITATVAASFGPISTDPTPSANPVPRFQPLTPPSDCPALGDCNSSYFPKLAADADSLAFDPAIGQGAQTRYIRVRNAADGLLSWAVSIRYKSGAGWLSVDPPSGFGNATVRVDASADGLTPGLYEATIVVDGGPLAGTKSFDVRMEAKVPGPPVGPPPVLTSVTHGATFERVPLAPGTLATAFGSRFTGQKVEVRISDVPARIFFSNDTQINFEVPAIFLTSGTVPVYVSVDSRNSLPVSLALSTASPGIFPGAILNQNNTPNAADNPAIAGSIVQIYLTGLPTTGNPVSVKIHDYTVRPVYAGAAPGFVGLQQVNAEVPSTLQNITADLSVCTGLLCSPPRLITVRQP